MAVLQEEAPSPHCISRGILFGDLDPFKDLRGVLAAADARDFEPLPGFAARHFVEARRQDADAGGPEGVAE